MSEPCDPEVFKDGSSIAIVDACMHRMEEWAQAVAKESGQKVDWHYSGGIANVLYLGDHAKVLAAINKLSSELSKVYPKEEAHHCRCPGPLHGSMQLFQLYGAEEHGPYRAGDEVPEGTIGVITTG